MKLRWKFKLKWYFNLKFLKVTKPRFSTKKGKEDGGGGIKNKKKLRRNWHSIKFIVIWNFLMKQFQTLSICMEENDIVKRFNIWN